MALTTLPFLKAALGVATDAQDVQWTACLNAADAAVKKYIRWNPEQVIGDVKYLDGSGLNEVVMPGLPTNLAVSEVRVDGCGGYGQIPGTFGSETLLALGTNYLVDYGAGILRMRQPLTTGWWWALPPGNPTGPSLYWGGLRNWGVTPAYWPRIPGCVKVTYTNGYAVGTIPADLQMGVCEIAAWLKRNALLSAFLNSESWNGEQYSLIQWQAEAYGALHLPVLGSARQLLAPYREPVLATGIRP